MRPHQALGGKVPADVYKPSERRLTRPAEFAYPLGWLVRHASRLGMISVQNEKYSTSRALAGQRVALEPIGGLRHHLWFRDMNLGVLEVAAPIDVVRDAAARILRRHHSTRRKVA